MGESGIPSALGATVGLSSRWEAGSLPQRVCGAMILGDCTVEMWRFYTDPVSPATLIDFFTGNLADWWHPMTHKLESAHRSLSVCRQAQKSQSMSNSALTLTPAAPVHSQLFRPPACAKRRRVLAGPSRPLQGEGGVAEHRLPQLLTHLPQPLPLIRILGCGRYPHRRGIALHSP